MDATNVPEWNGDPDALRAAQGELAGRVRLKDEFAKPLRTVAGFDVAFEDDGATTRAAAVLLDAETLQALETHVVRLPTRMPYLRGLLSFRELPALLEALALLSAKPDLCLIDGQGFAHPRRFGIACHFGVAADLPTIGVAEKVLVGTSSTALHEMRGAFTTLREGSEQIGWMLRSKPGCLPLIVSPGHRVAMATAPEMVMRFVTTYRMPEPTRLAERIASRRDE
ncbi:deoxyribonuclease V [Lysobacter sp. Root494]|uniref:deoxyribonuclease V n=1 Tax=Lysobacter sp. Root494 TaxID=1736549 RepID=UPI0006F74609|nr:deoxyribonuclease V [Lysobacter sp. Root494]KQY51866.1 endonuclease V [Lysobacter sp. Root494]